MTAPAQAQTAPVERRPAPAPPALRVDANATRQELMEILEKHPPSVGRVLKLDPSLMRSDSYLAAYPELRDFFAQHPEIPQNSPYYLEGVRVGFNDDYRPRNERVELVAGILGGLGRVHRRRHRALDRDLADSDDARTAALEPAVEDPGGSPLEADGPLLVERRAPDLRPDALGPPLPRVGSEPAAGNRAGDGRADLADPVVAAARRRAAGGRLGTAVPERPQH